MENPGNQTFCKDFYFKPNKVNTCELNARLYNRKQIINHKDSRGRSRNGHTQELNCFEKVHAVCIRQSDKEKFQFRSRQNCSLRLEIGYDLENNTLLFHRHENTISYHALPVFLNINHKVIFCDHVYGFIFFLV